MTTHKNPRVWLRLWVAETSEQAADQFDDRTPLFRDELLDSTDFVELLLVIEEALRRPLDVSTLRPENFQTIDAIVETFFSETKDVAYGS